MKYKSKTQDDSWMDLSYLLSKNWANIGMFPDVGKRSLIQRCLEKQSKDRCLF